MPEKNGFWGIVKPIMSMDNSQIGIISLKSASTNKNTTRAVLRIFFCEKVLQKLSIP